ncbi:hypothetical protein [Saccharophagus degradans]|uniref:Tetratricopeptide TPR_2 n=1 Tax=Saccharophagus degradans (strain 2-40 / ATCC 43961 / DSM 17024) TaxID=203122 RepID=Q21E01_SACD2|nr:hypothetical protein [Saccharophagus degradans]ABD83078.1 Tetratricopeptide TPR_2 [Saccharophagus degradans 2-40]
MNVSKFIATAIFTLGAAITQAETLSLKTAEQAYYNGHAMALENMLAESAPNDQLVIRYRLGSLALGKQNNEAAKNIMQPLMLDLENEVKANPKNAEAWGLLSSVYGMMTFLEPSMAMTYGPKAGFAEASAADADKHNPMVLMLTGVNKFHTPEQWGGGKQTAFDYLTKAINAYQAAGETRTWGYADALAWRGMAASALGNTDQAKKDIEASIKLQPNYGLAQQALAGM